MVFISWFLVNKKNALRKRGVLRTSLLKVEDSLSDTSFFIGPLPDLSFLRN